MDIRQKFIIAMRSELENIFGSQRTQLDLLKLFRQLLIQ